MYPATFRHLHPIGACQDNINNDYTRKIEHTREIGSGFHVMNTLLLYTFSRQISSAAQTIPIRSWRPAYKQIRCHSSSSQYSSFRTFCNSTSFRMKEAIVSKGPKVALHDVPVPKPGPDQVLIKVVVSGSNPKVQSF